MVRRPIGEGGPFHLPAFAVLCALLVLGPVPDVRAETFEIFPSTADCNEEFENLANSLQPGDELILHGGTYSQNCRRAVTVNGTAAQPIVIRAADGESPLLTRPDDNLDTQNNIEIDHSFHLILRGLRFKGGSTGVRFIGGDNITIEDCEIYETGNNAIAMNSGNSDSVIIRRNHIHHTGLSTSGSTEGEGVYGGCNNNACRVTNSLFEGNHIHHLRSTSGGGNDGIELKVGSYGNIIRDNVIHDTNIGTQFPCVFVYGGADEANIVEGNALWNCGEAIQVVSDAVIRNNLILTSVTGITAAPHAQVANMRNVTIVNNTIYGHDNECLYVRWSTASNMVLANNAVYCPGGTAVDAAGLSGPAIAVASNFVEGAMAGESIDGVRFLAGGTTASAFQDANAFDFWPAPGSALLESAAAGFVPTLDFNATTRSSPYDVGAYETEGLAQNPGWEVGPGFKTPPPSDDTPPSVPQDLNATAQSDAQIDLGWSPAADPESGISSYVIYRDDTEIAQTPSTSFSDGGLSESTTYVYQVSAINGAGLESALSSAVAETTPADTTPPELVSVVSQGDPTSVTVTFSETVAASSATAASNYSIDNGIVVNAASLAEDQTTVILSTTPHQEGVTYTLTVNNVTDQANNPNPVAANTQMSYAFVNELVVSNVVVASGRPYEVVEDLQDGSLAYIDRDYVYESVPADLLGQTYVMTANDDKYSEGDGFLSFDVNQSVTVYIAHDDRYENKPGWLAAFDDSGQDLSINGAFSLFRKDFPAGAVILGGNVNPGEIEDNSMYTVIIMANPVIDDVNPPQPPTGLQVY